MVPKDLQDGLEELEIGGQIQTTQTKILRSAEKNPGD